MQLFNNYNRNKVSATVLSIHWFWEKHRQTSLQSWFFKRSGNRLSLKFAHCFLFDSCILPWFVLWVTRSARTSWTGCISHESPVLTDAFGSFHQCNMKTSGGTAGCPSCTELVLLCPSCGKSCVTLRIFSTFSYCCILLFSSAKGLHLYQIGDSTLTQ